MNRSRRPNQTLVPLLCAALATAQLSLPVAALAQSPAGNYGQVGPYGPTGNLPGSPLITGSPNQPAQTARPAGWPGGPGVSEPAAPPPRRQYAAAFNNAPPGSAPAAAVPAYGPGSVPPAAGAPPAYGPGAAASATPPASYGNPAAPGAPPAGSAGREPTYVANNTRPPTADPDGKPAEPAAAKKMKYEGAEILARVGSEVVLAGDLLYRVNQTVDKIVEQNATKGTTFPPEAIEAGRVMMLKQALKQSIDTKLLYLAAKRKLPPEALPKIEKQFNSDFEKTIVKKMMEAENVNTRVELERKLRKMGTTLEVLRQQTFEAEMAQHWMMEQTKGEAEITHEDMYAFYQDHLAEYEQQPRVRWEHLMARFDKFSSKSEAYQAIAQWGNDVQRGVPFAEVAKAHSQDASADDGGVHSWTTKGSLVSDQLDAAVFELPVDTLSQIIEDARGFHILRVVERQDLTRTPFIEAQVEIKKKIRDERAEDKRKEFLAKVKKQIPVWTVFDEAEAAK